MHKSIREIISSDYFYCLILFIFSIVLLSSLVSPVVGGDALSMYVPAKKLLSDNNLNMWDQFNDIYNTYYFKMPFSDEAIVTKGESYPIQGLVTIFVYAFPMIFFGDTGFIYANPAMASLIVLIFFMLLRDLGFSKPISFVSSFVLLSMPIFLVWAIIPQNIIPATLFFMAALFFINRGQNENYPGYYFLAGMFLALSFFTRTPHILLIMSFLPFLLVKIKWPFFDINKTIIFILPIIFTFIIICFGNLYYFGDPLYQGYIQAYYHPDPLGLSTVNDLPAGSEEFLGMNYDINLLLNSIISLLEGSLKIFFPLIAFAIIGIIYSVKTNKKIVAFWLISSIVLVGYYSQITPLLYKPDDLNLQYSLVLAFFRYTLPIFVISIIGIPYFIILINECCKIKKKETIIKINSIILIMLMISSFASISLAYNYQGGASLKWYNELYSDKMYKYSEDFSGKIITGSVILYDSRWAIEMVGDGINGYHWFYYDGIPPASRYIHTNEIVNELLEDGLIVYFVHLGPPYNQLSATMESSLSANYTLSPVPSTWFPRLGAQFYQVMLMGE